MEILGMLKIDIMIIVVPVTNSSSSSEEVPKFFCILANNLVEGQNFSRSTSIQEWQI
jgi:hypothetical protein